MPRGSRRLLLATLTACCAVLAWFAWTPADAASDGLGTAPAPAAAGRQPPAGPRPRVDQEPTRRAVDVRTAVETPGADAKHAPGHGRIVLHPSFPMQPFVGSLALELALERGGDRRPLRWKFDSTPPISACAVADVPAGRWRIVVVHGPGDPPGLVRSQQWRLEPPEDIVAVAGETTRRLALIARATDAPGRGRCTIRGIATLDGRPAVDRPVRLAPRIGRAITRTDGSGLFEFRNVPAGHAELQLLGSTLGAAESTFPIHVLGRAPIAPLPGEVVDVALRGASSRIVLQLVDADGRPAGEVPVLLWAPIVLADVLPSEPRHDRPFRLATDEAGRIDQSGLPPARYRVTIGSDRRHPLLEQQTELPAGGSADLGVLRLPARASITLELEFAESSTYLPRRQTQVRLVPLDRTAARVPTTRPIRGPRARFRDIPPGRYQLELEFHGRRFAAARDLSIAAGENPSTSVLLRPTSDVDGPPRPSRSGELDSKARR